jgi:DNA-binding response OmpR family regulator
VNARGSAFKTEWVRHLSAAIIRLSIGDIDAIIVDLLLPDSSGITTFDQLLSASLHTPIITLYEEGEEDISIMAVSRGAQGYLSKDHFVNNLVPQHYETLFREKSGTETLCAKISRRNRT